MLDCEKESGCLNACLAIELKTLVLWISMSISIASRLMEFCVQKVSWNGVVGLVMEY